MGELWYVRKQSEVQGPFPASLISRLAVLGRIRPTDELSQDGDDWHAFAALRHHFPEAAHAQEDPDAAVIAKMREDERSGNDRRRHRRGGETGPAERRLGADRRRSEPPRIVRHREHRLRLTVYPTLSARQIAQRFVAVAGVLAAAVTAAFLLSPKPAANPQQCASAPRPGVNWSNCTLENVSAPHTDLTGASLQNGRFGNAELLGAKMTAANLSYGDFTGANLSYADLKEAILTGTDLRQADLSYADLRQANLAYANLSGANLGGAELQGARFNRAIWVNGVMCGPGSIGRCQPQGARLPSDP